MMPVKTLWALLLIAGTSTAWAVAGGPPVEPVAGQAWVDIDVEDADPGEVLAQLAQALGLELEMETTTDRRLTMRLIQVEARTALRAACESVGCRWRVEARGGAPGVLEVSFPERGDRRAPAGPVGAEGDTAFDHPVSVSLRDAELEAVLLVFARMTEHRLEIDPELAERKVTVEVEKVPARVILDVICRMQHCRWQALDDPEPILRVERAP